MQSRVQEGSLLLEIATVAVRASLWSGLMVRFVFVPFYRVTLEGIQGLGFLFSTSLGRPHGYALSAQTAGEVL